MTWGFGFGPRIIAYLGVKSRVKTVVLIAVGIFVIEPFRVIATSALAGLVILGLMPNGST